MPKHGDIIIFTDPGRVAMGLVRSGVRYRLDRARRKSDFRFTNLHTGGSVDWFAHSLRSAAWSFAG